MPTTVQPRPAHAQDRDRGNPVKRPITKLIATLAARDRGAVTRIAASLGVDRTTVAHWLGDGERPYYVPADALAAVCDGLDSVEPLRAIADELDLELVPRTKTPSVPSLRRAVSALTRDTCSLSIALEEALEGDGRIDEVEALTLDAQLAALIETAKAARARLGVTP